MIGSEKARWKTPRWLRQGATAIFAGALVLPVFVTTAQAANGNDDLSQINIAEDDPALDWDNYDKVKITGNTGEPIGMALLPDSRILHTARDGVVRLTDPSTGLTEQIANIDVYHNSEDGLQGIALDPNFAENNWVYTVYSPRVMSGTAQNGAEYPETTPPGSSPEMLPDGEDESYWDQWLGYNVLSRFKFDPETNEFDLDSEEEIIKIEAQRGQCCHVGADIAFDKDGNILVSTGDNTPAGTPGANAYTPIRDFEGTNPGHDARRGAGNTNDLRGAILRLNVLDEIAEDAEPGEGETYTIPEGNLFEYLDENTDYEFDDSKVRHEIYVMGLRNPFRMAYDAEADVLFWGEYGPDARSAQADRGPMGYVEWQLTDKPMAGGWPYCHGPNDDTFEEWNGAYNEWDFENNEPGDLTFDCAAPVNNSSWNTGEKILPPTTEPQLWYGNNPGDQPSKWDGLVNWGDRGGQAPMGGPMYRYDADNPSPTKFPEAWDGAFFMGEFSQQYMTAFFMDEYTSEGEVTELYDFFPNPAIYEQGSDEWAGIIDMEFGDDGSLYVLEYGFGFFRQNPEAGIYRIDYSETGAKTPRAVIKADPIAGSEAPLTVSFDASDSGVPGDLEGTHELEYEWDFGDGETASGVEVEHTYDDLGQYDAVLRVSDVDGRQGVTTQQITVGNTAPEITLSVDNGSIFEWGDSMTVDVDIFDVEDGDDIDYDSVEWTFGLGHNDHAHPEVSGTGTPIEINTSAAAKDHGEGEKIFGTLVVKYTDKGTEDTPPVTGEASMIFKPEDQPAAWYDSEFRVERVRDADVYGGEYITGFGDKGTITYDPIALTHAPSGEPIDLVRALGKGTGSLFLTWDDDTEPFATFDFDDEDWTEVYADIDQPGDGSGRITVSGEGDVDLSILSFFNEDNLPPICTDPGAEISASDDFEGDKLDPCRWNVVNYNSDLIEVNDGTLNITTTDADINGPVNDTVPNILQSKVLTDDEWTVETKLDATALNSQWHQGGIMVYADDDNYAKIDILYGDEQDGNQEDGLRFEIRSEVDGDFQQPSSPDPEGMSAQDYYLQLTRSGDTFTGAYSTDGENWTDIPGSVSNPNLDGVGPGLYALGKSQTSPTTVSFDYFHVVDEDVPEPDPVLIEPERVGVQTFSLNPWVGDEGIPAVFEALSNIGLQNIEPWGGNFSDYTAEEFRELTDGLGLSVPASHYNVGEDDFDETLEFVKTLGQEYVGSGGFPAPGINSLENTLATAETMNRLGEAAVEAGVGKFYGHNHSGEFTTKYEYEGETLSAWEILVLNTDPEYVAFELDVAWAANAGENVPGLLEKYGERIELMHVKDAVNLGGEGGPSFRNLGEGDVPLPAILAAAEEHANISYYFMEYDNAADGLSFVTTGYEYLTGEEAGDPSGPEKPVLVTPDAVEFSDEDSTYTIPEVEGVEYLIDDEVVTAGTHDGEGTVTVTARAVEGFEIEEGATTSWEHTFIVPGPDFVDVPADYKYFEEISWLLEQGITYGYDDGTYRPLNDISREAMAAFLYRDAGEPSYDPPTVSPFTDVKTSHGFYKEITWLAEQGITTGYSDGTFRPKNEITREAMSAFLYRYADVEGYEPDGTQFSDVGTNHNFYTEISWLADEGITTGYSDGTFRPKNEITREATAAFLYRLNGN